MNDEPTAIAPGMKDRKTGLVVFGIFGILLGALCALAVLMMLLGQLIQPQGPSTPPINASSMIAGVLFYILLAVWFIWLGIGSIRARRWARALLLISSWGWLISGICGLVFMVLIMPGMWDQMAKDRQMPPEAVAVFKFVMIGFMAIFYIVIPGAWSLFYGSKHVKATCEWRDQQVRWTDKCPLPVLALSLLSGVYAVCMPAMGLYGWAIPFFGTVLNGAAGALVALTGACLLGYLAWGLYRLRVAAWWCAVCLVTLGGISTSLTFSRVNLMDLYAKMGFSAQQLEMMKQLLSPQFQAGIKLGSGLGVVVALAYLLFVRRYFTLPAASPNKRSTLDGQTPATDL